MGRRVGVGSIPKGEGRRERRKEERGVGEKGSERGRKGTEEGKRKEKGSGEGRRRVVVGSGLVLPKIL